MGDEDEVQQVMSSELEEAMRLQTQRPERPKMDLGISDEERELARAHARITLWQETVPARFHDAVLEGVTAEGGARGQLETWVQQASTDGVNLLITGPVGAGKTWAGVAAVRPLFFGGCSMLFTPMERLLSMLDWKNPERVENERRLSTVDVLLLDDLGTQRENAWVQEVIYGIVNNRWMDDLPTVGTTNLAPDPLREALGERTYSRLTGALVGVRLGGEDRRREGRS